MVQKCNAFLKSCSAKSIFVMPLQVAVSISIDRKKLDYFKDMLTSITNITLKSISFKVEITQRDNAGLHCNIL